MCDCASSPCGCNDLNIAVGPAGRPGEAGPPPGLAIGTVTTLAPGDPATATITGTAPDYEINLGIPAGATGAGTPGADGTDGINAFSTLAFGWTINGVGFSSDATFVDASWVAPGQWVYLENGGFFYVVSVVGNVVTLMNYGTVGNQPPFTLVPGSSKCNPAGVPGADGATGPAGATGATGPGSIVSLVTSIPVSAPAPGYEFQFYTDNLTLPTIFRAYSWNGSVWTAGPNLLSGLGSTTTVTVISGPVSVPINFQYSRTNITTSADITLAANLGSLVDHGAWQVYVYKGGGGSVNIAYASIFDKKSGLTLPTSIGTGETFAFIIRMGYSSTRPIIEDAYEVVATP